MNELNPSKGVTSEYALTGSIHCFAAKELLGLLTQTDCYSPWAAVASLMSKDGSSPDLKTWQQTLEVAEKIFNTVDAPETESALSVLKQQQPPPLLALALLLFADWLEPAESPLPETMRSAFLMFLSGLQFKRLVNQVVARNDAETHALNPNIAAIINMQAGIRSFQSAAAKASRPRKSPTLQSEFKAAMQQSKRNGETLSTFIASVEARSVSGLRLRSATGRNVPGYDLQSEANDSKWEYRAHETVSKWWKAIKVD